MEEIIAVINNDSLFVRHQRFCLELDADGEKLFRSISEEITKMITTDSRFIEAIGKENAEKASFSVELRRVMNNETHAESFIVIINMSIGQVETDFDYYYMFMSNSECPNYIDAPSTLYRHGNKTVIMTPFDFYVHGFTSCETFKSQEVGDASKSIESVFAEILSEDFVVIKQKMK